MLHFESIFLSYKLVLVVDKISTIERNFFEATDCTIKSLKIILKRSSNRRVCIALLIYVNFNSKQNKFMFLLDQLVVISVSSNLKGS